MAALLAVGCKEPTGPEREIDGERLFFQHCARCHGIDGKGLADVSGVRDLTDPVYMGTMTDDQVRRTIQRGKPPNMPAFGRQFAEPSLEVLIAYVRRLNTKKPASTQPPASKPTGPGAQAEGSTKPAPAKAAPKPATPAPVPAPQGP